MTPEERFERIERHLASVAAHLDQVSERLDRVSGRLDRAVRLGVREVRAERRRRQKAMEEIDNKITQLAAAQLVTEEKLQGLIESLRRERNGHG